MTVIKQVTVMSTFRITYIFMQFSIRDNLRTVIDDGTRRRLVKAVETKIIMVAIVMLMFWTFKYFSLFLSNLLIIESRKNLRSIKLTDYFKEHYLLLRFLYVTVFTLLVCCLTFDFIDSFVVIIDSSFKCLLENKSLSKI